MASSVKEKKSGNSQQNKDVKRHASSAQIQLKKADENELQMKCNCEKRRENANESIGTETR